ncbi:MAG TPA: hypothetical protein VJL90_09815 [Pseudorhodoplanes sp.]|nr:hypothetical protein [Pseudorhodoplanes sp.]
MTVSLEAAYSSLRPSLEKVLDLAEDPLRNYAAEKGFFMVGRIKDFASVRDKVETGEYANLGGFDDLVALTIVVDTRDQITPALSKVKELFSVSLIKDFKSVPDERLFTFDSTRAYVNLKLSNVTSPLAKVRFEIQIKTLLQYAWGKITHPLVYKPAKLDSKRMRLAAELLANFEGIDRDLARFGTIAQYCKPVEGRVTKSLNRVADMLEGLLQGGEIPAEMRPPNMKRTSENIYNLISDPRKNEAKAVKSIREFLISEAAAAMSLSLTQLAIVALFRSKLLRMDSGRPRYHFITPEMISLFPEATKVPHQFALA